MSEEVFTERAVKHWHGLPEKAMDAPFLGMFKARLNRALVSWSCWEAVLPLAGG